MGIVNCTPDSFSDGGKFETPQHAIDHVKKLFQQGADIIDIGAESTRPNQKQPIDHITEWNRIEPILNLSAQQCSDIPLSIDTSNAKIMEAAVQAGFRMINDVRSFTLPGAMTVAVEATDTQLVCMHTPSDLQNMMNHTDYDDCTQEVAEYLKQRKAAVVAAGADENRILVDPGFGFGKLLDDNLELLRSLRTIKSECAAPVVAGISRKRMLGDLTGEQRADQRLGSSIAAALLAVENGADIVRVHDVKETVDALRIAKAVRL